MMPRVVANSGMETTLDSRNSRVLPAPIPPRATPMGSPIPSTEPPARMRMTMAKARPSSSEEGGSKSPKIWPPYSTRTPARDGSRSWTASENSAASSWSVSPGSSSSA